MNTVKLFGAFCLEVFDVEKGCVFGDDLADLLLDCFFGLGESKFINKCKKYTLIVVCNSILGPGGE